MLPLSLLPVALRELGLPTLFQYAVYQLSLRSGWLRRRTPRRAWPAPQSPSAVPGSPEVKPPAGRPLLFDSETNFSSALATTLHGLERDLRREADAILRGEFRLFGAEARPLGFPPAWNTPPGAVGAPSPAPLPADRHWTAYEADSRIDLRSVWELSRLGWIFPLARAYRLTGDPRYWEGCWSLLASWRAANPPNTGPQWASAQEAGLRILPLTFAWQAFAPELKDRPEGAAGIQELVHACAARIPPSLSYARAQRNNHLLSEAVGMYTAGALFPEPLQARRWRRQGARWLERALADQVFPDGGYIQHSVNYHRLALSLGLWALCLARALGEPFPAQQALERLARALAALAEPEQGSAPQLGHDDGSQILPLSQCAQWDQRPILQAAWRALFEAPAFPFGPWDELSLWLGLLPPGSPSARHRRRGAPARRPRSAALREPAPDQRLRASDLPDAGLYFLRGAGTWAMLRCARFRTRPAHSDQLHLDLWHDGRNLALDPGTYLYAAPPPWDNALARASAHNGPLAEGCEPMRRVSRFLWLEWAQGRLIGRWRSSGGALEALIAEHSGYRRRGWRVRRAVVRAGEDLWLVVDELLGQGAHPLRITWTLPDLPWELDGRQLRLGGRRSAFRLHIVPPAVEIGLYRAGVHLGGAPTAQAGEAATLGWFSPTYSALEPALTVTLRLPGSLPLRLETWWSFGGAQPAQLRVHWSSPVSLRQPFERVAWKGEEIWF
jgi:hypothetical protein